MQKKTALLSMKYCCLIRIFMEFYDNPRTTPKKTQPTQVFFTAHLKTRHEHENSNTQKRASYWFLRGSSSKFPG